MKRRLAIGLAALSIGAVVVVAVLVLAPGHPQSSGAGTTLQPVGGQPRPRAPSGPVPTLAREPAFPPRYAIVNLLAGARVPLRRFPGGALVQVLTPHTQFGSTQVLGVVRQQGSWLAVSSPARDNGSLGWIRFDPSKLELYWTRYSLRVIVSERRMELRYGDRLLASYVVSVGAPGNRTPTGRFAITDALFFNQSPYYGCCALALSGHQDHLPPGWLGGDRIAIHGTPGPVGYYASHGCIRATDATMRTLFRSVPLGTPVFVTS